MRLVLNVIWFVLAELWMAIGYAIAAPIMFVLIVTRFRRSYAPIGATSVIRASSRHWPRARATDLAARHTSCRDVGRERPDDRGLHRGV